MRMRSEHGRHPPIEMPSECDFLRSRLGMDLHDDRVGLPLELLNHPISTEERAVGFHAHKRATEYREHRHPKTTFFNDEVIPPRIRPRQIRRTTHVFDLADLVFPSALVPHVVTQSDRIDAAPQNGFGNRSRNPRAGGGVLSIGDDKINAVLGAHARQFFGKNIPAGSTHDVTDEKQF